MTRRTTPRKRLTPGADGRLVVASNRRARYNFEILDTVEAGLALTGSEVKSLREGTAQMAEAYAVVQRGEVWLLGLHIPPYAHASLQGGHVPDARRKLLLHRYEIDRLASRLDQERLTLVPLQLYFRNGRAKLELGLAKGKREYDKRETIKRRESDLEARREMARFGRR